MKKNAQAAMTLKASSKVDIKAEGNANLKASIEADDIAVNAAGSSELAITSSGENATVSCSGSSQSSISFEGEKAVVSITASADVDLTGKGDELTINGEKSSSLEAGGFDAKSVTATLNGPVKANVTAQESLDATLTGGSTLYYSGTPAFKIGRIVRSTLAPYGTSR